MKVAALAAGMLAAAAAVQPPRETILASQEVMDYLERIKAKDPLARTPDEQSVLAYALAHEFHPYPTDHLEDYTHMVGVRRDVERSHARTLFEEVMHRGPNWWEQPARTTIRLGHHRPQVQNPPGSNARPKNVQQRKSRKANRRKRG